MCDGLYIGGRRGQGGGICVIGCILVVGGDRVEGFVLSEVGFKCWNCDCVGMLGTCNKEVKSGFSN